LPAWAVPVATEADRTAAMSESILMAW